MLSKGSLPEKLPSTPELAALPRTPQAGWEWREASGLACLSQPRGGQGAAAGAALGAGLCPELESSGLPGLQGWGTAGKKNPAGKGLKCLGEERGCAAQEASMYWSRN